MTLTVNAATAEINQDKCNVTPASRSSSSKFMTSTIPSTHKNRAETSKLSLDRYAVIQLLVVLLVVFGVLLDMVQLLVLLERYCSRQITKVTTLTSTVLIKQEDDDDGAAKGEKLRVECREF